MTASSKQQLSSKQHDSKQQAAIKQQVAIKQQAASSKQLTSNRRRRDEDVVEFAAAAVTMIIGNRPEINLRHA